MSLSQTWTILKRPRVDTVVLEARGFKSEILACQLQVQKRNTSADKLLNLFQD
jgi:hypothetical protein